MGIIKTIRVAWTWILAQMESGDLVPLLVLVSAAHYVKVLAGHDAAVTAVAVGLLVDLGHYRAIIVATRYGGKRRFESVTRWAVAIVMTALSLTYHLRYYGGDWALALPMPVLIASLAYFERKGFGNTTAVDNSLTGSVKETDKADRQMPMSLTTEQRRQQLLTDWRQRPDASQTELAARYGVSRQTVSNDWQVLERTRQARKNGHGVEVLV